MPRLSMWAALRCPTLAVRAKSVQARARVASAQSGLCHGGLRGVAAGRNIAETGAGGDLVWVRGGPISQTCQGEACGRGGRTANACRHPVDLRLVGCEGFGLAPRSSVLLGSVHACCSRPQVAPSQTMSNRASAFNFISGVNGFGCRYVCVANRHPSWCKLLRCRLR